MLHYIYNVVCVYVCILHMYSNKSCECINIHIICIFTTYDVYIQIHHIYEYYVHTNICACVCVCVQIHLSRLVQGSLADFVEFAMLCEGQMSKNCGQPLEAEWSPADSQQK